MLWRRLIRSVAVSIHHWKLAAGFAFSAVHVMVCSLSSNIEASVPDRLMFCGGTGKKNNIAWELKLMFLSHNDSSIMFEWLSFIFDHITHSMPKFLESLFKPHYRKFNNLTRGIITENIEFFEWHGCLLYRIIILVMCHTHRLEFFTAVILQFYEDILTQISGDNLSCSDIVMIR